MKIRRFTGINNVQPPERLLPNANEASSALREAMNCDLGLDGQLMRREGFTELSATRFENVWQGDGFLLATTTSGDLVAIAEGDDPEDAVTLYESLGFDRVWYWNWPDGRTAFSNGLINGIATATGATKWGVPVPDNTFVVTAIEGGELFAGSYRVSITYVRSADGLEGGQQQSLPVTVAADGAILVESLPTLAGHTINVYLTSHNGTKAYLAGNTATDTFTFDGANDELLRECLTEHLDPAPVGTLSAIWRGRALVAVGSTLYASRPGRPEHFDLSKDWKPLADTITLVQPVEGGIFVGTESELVYLRGTTWDQLAFEHRIKGRVVLGSGVTVPGKYLVRGEGTAGAAAGMLCIADGVITAGYADGAAVALTEGVYQTDATEVAAVFRIRSEADERIPQYVAIPQ